MAWRIHLSHGLQCLLFFATLGDEVLFFSRVARLVDDVTFGFERLQPSGNAVRYGLLLCDEGHAAIVVNGGASCGTWTIA